MSLWLIRNIQMQLCRLTCLCPRNTPALLLDKDLVTEQAGLGGGIGVWQAFGKVAASAAARSPPIPDLHTWTKERRGGNKFPKTVHRSVGHHFLFWNSGYSHLSSEGFNIQNLSLKLQLLGNSDINFSTNNFIFLYLCVTWLCVHCLLVSSNTKNQKLTFSSRSLNAIHRHSAGTCEVTPLGSGHWPSC